MSAESSSVSFDAFLSYSSSDSQAVVAIESLLRFAGVSTFLDEKDIRGGDNIVEAVFDAISDARAMIVFISESSRSSRWVTEEYSAARMAAMAGRDLRVIPVLLSGNADDIPPALRHLKYRRGINVLTDPDGRRELVSQLLTDLGVQRHVPTSDITRYMIARSGLVSKSIRACARLNGYALCAMMAYHWFREGDRRASMNALSKFMYEWDEPMLDQLVHQVPGLVGDIARIDGKYADLTGRVEDLLLALQTWLNRRAGSHEIQTCVLASEFLEIFLAEMALNATLDLVAVITADPHQLLGDISFT